MLFINFGLFLFGVLILVKHMILCNGYQTIMYNFMENYFVSTAPLVGNVLISEEEAIRLFNDKLKKCDCLYKNPKNYQFTEKLPVQGENKMFYIFTHKVHKDYQFGIDAVTGEIQCIMELIMTSDYK